MKGNQERNCGQTERRTEYSRSGKLRTKKRDQGEDEERRHKLHQCQTLEGHAQLDQIMESALVGSNNASLVYELIASTFTLVPQRIVKI